MVNNENFDLNIILTFANHYEQLENEGEITEKQLDQILSILDRFEKISTEKLKKRIDEIFN